jgi:hypothetical protein
LPDPQFEGQTKAKLGNPEAKVAVESIVADALADFLERNPQDAKAIIERCVLSQKARKAARAAKETVLRKGILDGLALPGKLADCTSRKPEECELFIVEGDSAGGSSKQARDRHFQAILPLRGKILNVERARLDKMLASKEIKSLVIALGTAIADDFNIEKARYHRIVIMCDADEDGSTWGIEVGKNIEHYLRSKGVNFILETTATDVDIKAKEVITTNNRVNYDKLFIATGRANSKFVNGILKKYNIDLKKSYLDIGCRFEIEYSDKVKQLSSLQYDFKLKDTVVTDNVSKDCRTFCVCHYSSYVAEEEKDGQFLGYNGHAYGLQAHDKKNNLTNFGILINLQNIDADEIMKVARNNKCQVLGSNISFTPSLPDYNIISHNEFKTLPAGIEILEFIKKLDNILAFGNNYKIYYPEIKEGSGKLEAPNKWQAPGLDDLYFVGDSAFCMHDGSTRGIVPAGVSGISAIDIALNKLSPL